MNTKTFIISALFIGLLGLSFKTYSQTLTDPYLVLDRHWSEDTWGNFLMVNSSKEIRKSPLTYSEIKKLEEKVNNLSSLSDNMNRKVNKLEDIVEQQKRQLYEMDKKVDKLEDLIEQQSRKIYDLERKIK
jgi:peptidoglycan hydrolase CwlO-like protein